MRITKSVQKKEIKRKEKIGGPERKVYGPTFMGEVILGNLGEIRWVVEQKPSNFATVSEVSKCLNLLRTKRKPSRRLGADLFYQLCGMKCITHDPRVAQFFLEIIEDPSYDKMADILLVCVRIAFFQPYGRKAPANLDINKLKNYCLEGRNAFCTSISLALLTWVDQKVAVEMMIRMVAENDDERYDGISMKAAASKSLTPEYQRLLDEEFLKLIERDPRERNYIRICEIFPKFIPSHFWVRTIED